MEIEVVEDSGDEMSKFFDARIEEFNQIHWEVKKKFPLALKVENENGEIVAGVAAKTFGLWLLIENLWVSETLRGGQWGSKILKKLEAEAQKRGCKFVLLDTLNFQAREFYEKFGYEVRWTQEQYPRDGCKHFMVKEL